MAFDLTFEPELALVAIFSKLELDDELPALLDDDLAEALMLESPEELDETDIWDE